MVAFTDKKYINIAFVVALLILVSVNIVIYLNLKFRFYNEELINKSLIVTQNAEELYSNLIEAETNRRGFLITGNEEFIDLYRNAIVNLDSSFQLLSTLISQTKFHGNVIDSLRILIRERKNIWEESIKLQKEKGVNFRVQKEHVLKGKELTERIKRNITSIQLTQRNILEESLVKTGQSANYSLINLVIGSSIAFVLLITSVYFLNRNITLRKESEKRLEDNRKRLYTILESIGDGVIVTNKIGEVEFLNKRARELTGWSNEDSNGLLAEHVFQIIDELSGKVQENPVKKVIATGKNTGIYDNTLVKSKTGVLIPIDHIASPVYDENADLSGVVLVFRDISEKRKAEKELLERRKFIQKIADSVPSIIYIYILKGPALTYVNYKITDLLGFSPEDVVSSSLSDLYKYVHKDDIENIKKNIDRHNKSSDEPVIYEYRVKNSKGEYRWFRSYEVVFTKDRNGDPLEILGSTFDITEQKLHENELAEYRQHLESLVQMRTSELERINRKLIDEISEREKAEAEIKETEEKFRSLVENALIGIYILQGEKLVYANPRYCEIFGYDNSEIIGKEFDFVVLDEYKVTLRQNIDQILSGSIIRIESSFKARKKSGEVIDVELGGVSIQYKGGKAMIGTVMDVTDRNKLIEDIRNANNRYDLIVESSNAIVYDYNVSSGEIQWGGTVNKVLGYEHDEFSGGIKQWESLIHPDDREEAVRLLQEAENSGKAYDVEYRFKKKDGKYIWFYDRGFFIYDSEGKATRMLGMMQDITARKEFEFELQRERDLFTGGPVIIFRWKREKEWPVEYVSKNIEQYGYSREDFISGKIKYASIIHPDDLERIAREVEYYTKNNFKNFEQYYRIRKADGDYIELYDFTVTVRDENGEIAYYDGYVFDITELKNAESELKRQKDFLRTIIDTDPNFIFVKDWDGKFTLVNKAVADLYGTTVENLIGKTDADFNPRKDEVEHFQTDDREVMSTGLPKLIPEEPVTNSRTGETRWYQTIKVPLSTDDKKQVLGISTDITARKLAEEITLKSLRDKENLLKEIHHRVKNNLQIIISLLKLQSRYIYDSRDAELFAYSKSRVETLSLVHEKLYRDRNIFIIDMKSYLNDLIVHRIKSYNMNHIEYELSVNDIECNIDNAIPIGLIINEIVIHILTKSFTKEYPGILKVFVRKNMESIDFLIYDNGQSVADDFNSDSMSTQLIEALLKQLDGRISYEFDNGNKFNIVFREIKYKERI